MEDYDNQFQQRGQPEYKSMEKKAPLQSLFNNSMRRITHNKNTATFFF
jgi:hypothetical protein